MEIDVYCDESYPDLFCSKLPQIRYLFIGSVWLDRANRNIYKSSIHKLRDEYKFGGEFKWSKVSPSKLDFYIELIDWFFDQGNNLRFRCIAVDHEQVDLIQFHQSDQELGFYKFYYQVLHHWIHSFNSYNIYCDHKNNRLRNRLRTLHACLSNSNLTALIGTVQSVRSEESVLIQLSDVLVGLASARMNESLVHGSAKETLALHLEQRLRRKISPTAQAEKKFNVFRINLQGGVVSWHILPLCITRQ